LESAQIDGLEDSGHALIRFTQQESMSSAAFATDRSGKALAARTGIKNR